MNEHIHKNGQGPKKKKKKTTATAKETTTATHYRMVYRKWCFSGNIIRVSNSWHLKFSFMSQNIPFIVVLERNKHADPPPIFWCLLMLFTLMNEWIWNEWILHLYSAFSMWTYSNALYNTLWGTLADYFMA